MRTAHFLHGTCDRHSATNYRRKKQFEINRGTSIAYVRLIFEIGLSRVFVPLSRPARFYFAKVLSQGFTRLTARRDTHSLMNFVTHTFLATYTFLDRVLLTGKSFIVHALKRDFREVSGLIVVLFFSNFISELISSSCVSKIWVKVFCTSNEFYSVTNCRDMSFFEWQMPITQSKKSVAGSLKVIRLILFRLAVDMFTYFGLFLLFLFFVFFFVFLNRLYFSLSFVIKPNLIYLLNILLEFELLWMLIWA